tara:strand:- start:70 stop:777 length:708 start_codon:yes stop_codon:yes gene_type:complete
MIRKQIKKSIDITQHAQRNYDLSKVVPSQDLETLVYAAVNSPSKQNETHYRIAVYTDQDIIKQIYNNTQKFTLGAKQALADGKTEDWLYENQSVKNSQILANVLFVYIDDNGDARGATHLKAQNDNKKSMTVLNEQKNYSIGISIGELILTASLLGYYTGICSAFKGNEIKKILNTDDDIKLLVGIGYENVNIDRRLHAEALNSDVPESFRNGALNDKWQFPSFEKNIKVTINGN